MPFAGRMKLKHFLLLAGVGAVGLGGLAWALWPGMPQPKTLAERVEAANVTASEDPPEWASEPPVKPEGLKIVHPPDGKVTNAVVNADGSVPAASPWPSALDHERAIARFIDKPISGGKKKDITSGRGAKVNLYMDDGASVMNRAKVDLDRDERWDEKWTFREDGSIQRKVAPKDDEDYTEAWIWDGKAWVPEA